MTLPHLTLAYMTCRKEPMLHWFLNSLKRECGENYEGLKVIVISLHDIIRREELMWGWPELWVYNPMPSVWQGTHRLTKRDYFAASNARNTALCLAPDGWIAYVDDLSVLMPGWLACVREAMEKNYIALGCYMKVKNLQVDSEGNATYDVFPPGIDSRLAHIPHEGKAVFASGSWLFGCSVAMPVEALLTINGWDNDCDSLGGEDYVAGIMMERAGYKFWYDQRMMTLESEERHHDGSALPRFDKGKSPNDKSHAMLNMVLAGRNKAPNYFGEGGIRAVRERVLQGEPFPIIQCPSHDWYDGQPLSEL